MPTIQVYMESPGACTKKRGDNWIYLTMKTAVFYMKGSGNIRYELRKHCIIGDLKEVRICGASETCCMNGRSIKTNLCFVISNSVFVMETLL